MYLFLPWDSMGRGRVRRVKTLDYRNGKKIV